MLSLLKQGLEGPLDDTQQEDLLLSILSSDVQERVLGKLYNS